MTSLSKIIAGTMNWGVWGRNLDAVGMSALIELFVENDITSFDHADIYGGYSTEASFGIAFRQCGINRQDVEYISKCGIQHTDGNRPTLIKHYDYSTEYIIWSVENSLKNLQTDYLDVLLLHRPSPLMESEQIAEAVKRLRQEGKILEFGVSNFTPSQTDLIRRHTDVKFNQIQFSATSYEPMTDGSLDHMQLHGIRPMAWNPLGCVFRGETPQSIRLNKLFNELGSKYNVTPDILLLAWIFRHPANVMPVIGTTSKERIGRLSSATALDFSLEDWFAIWTESMGNKVP